MIITVKNKTQGFSESGSKLYKKGSYFIGSRTIHNPAERLLLIAHLAGVIGIVIEAENELPGTVLGWSGEFLERVNKDFYHLHPATIEEITLTLNN